MQAQVGEPGVVDPMTWICHPQSSEVVGVHPKCSQAQQPRHYHQESTCSCYTSQRYICPTPDAYTCQNNAGATQEQWGQDQALCQANPWVSLIWTCHWPALLQLWVLHLQAALPKSIRAQQEQCLHWPGPDPDPLTFHSWPEKWPRPCHAQTRLSLSPLRGDGGSEDEDQSQRGKDNPHHHGGWSVHLKRCNPDALQKLSRHIANSFSAGIKHTSCTVPVLNVSIFQKKKRSGCCSSRQGCRLLPHVCVEGPLRTVRTYSERIRRHDRDRDKDRVSHGIKSSHASQIPSIRAQWSEHLSSTS